ncbi:MAG: hypothetical protein H6741_29200 [Alphaproteobacteria bacterium]|nr:hypothetical protein [Alphaproteobacteria bacterium]MCB9796797.1 hypothetical protein [Alphaproteobacteria bacterium]
MSRLLPPERSPAERSRTVTRAAGAAAALVLLTLLSMKLASRLVDGAPEVAETTQEEAPPPAEVPESEPIGLKVTSIEPVQLRVDLDGVEAFSGRTCTGGAEGCQSGTLEFPLAKVTTVELGDLTRATVVYKGTRVQPLGNLSVSRKLVFIDDTDD